MTIEIDGRFHIRSDQGFHFTDEAGFVLEGTSPALINEGRISFDYSLDVSDVAAISATADDALFWNRAGGRLVIDASRSTAAEVIPIELLGADNRLRNDGDIVMTGGPWTVGLLGGERAGFHFVNTGLFEVTGAGRVTGAYLGEGAQTHNTGAIRVSSTEGGAMGAYVLGAGGGAGRFVNTGLIEITGSTDATGISLRDAYQGFRLENDGRLIAHATAPGAGSLGILLPFSDQRPVTIDNAGLIRAGIAIEDLIGVPVTILNSGRIVGDILLYGEPERVINTGLIRGQVELGRSDDLFNGAHGQLQGVLWGGYGADTLIGGRAGDEIHGGDATGEDRYDAADLVKGHGGKDSLYGGGGADTLAGGKGADLLDGGAGGDLLRGGGGGDVFRYDLLADSAPTAPDRIEGLKAHDRIDLSAIDADTTTAGDQAFHLVAALTGHAGELAVAYDAGSDETTVSGDVDGDGAADLVLVIVGHHLGGAGFVL